MAGLSPIGQGLTAQQLDDRILPKPPQLTLDYGSRRFEVKLALDGRLLLIEDNGDRHNKLPKPKGSDDRALGATAASAMENGREAVRLNPKIRASAAGTRMEDSRWLVC